MGNQAELPKRITLGDEESPEIHIFDQSRDLNKSLNQEFTYLRQINTQTTEYLRLSPGVSFVLENYISLQPSYLIARNVDGKRFKIPTELAQKEPILFRARFREVTEIENVLNASLDPELIKSIKRSLENSDFRTFSLDQQAKIITEMQLKTSSNASGRDDDYSRGILNANRLLIEILNSGASLTVDNLLRVNAFSNAGRTVLHRSNGAHFVGILRGTAKVLQIKESLYLVDNTHIQVHQSTEKLNTFLPASEVPTRIEKLVKQINLLSAKTSLDIVFEIYREFIKIHPFVDGNGRTGRMLLNFMLLKTGFPPMLVASESLYFNSLELSNRYIAIILNQ